MILTMSADTTNPLPDSIADLFNLQKNIISELQAKNEIHPVMESELSFLKKQNYLLKARIESVYDLMDRLCPGSEPRFMGIA